MPGVTTKLKIDLKGTILQQKGERAALIANQELKQAMILLLKQGATFARLETPIGASSKLRNSVIVREPKGRKVVHEGSVRWTAPYAKLVDAGGPPRTVQIGRLRAWARVVLGDESAAVPIQKAIQKRGTPSPAHPNPGKGMSDRVNVKWRMKQEFIMGIAAKNVAQRL